MEQSRGVLRRRFTVLQLPRLGQRLSWLSCGLSPLELRPFCELAVERRRACGAALRGETAGKQNGGSFRTPASYAEHPHNVKMYRMVQCGFENKLKQPRVAALAARKFLDFYEI